MATPADLYSIMNTDAGEQYIDRLYEGDPNHPDLEQELLRRKAEMIGSTPDRILTDMYFNRRK